MSIDPRYVAAADLQQTIYDKSGSGSLAGGLVYFYQDNSRTVLQNVYELTGNAPNYSFSPLPNPVVLSSIGSFMDDNGNDVIPYYLPWLIVNGEITETVSLYYVVVQNADFIPQFTREAWPPNSYANNGGGGGGGIQTDFNYIPNGQFLAHNNLPESGLIVETSTIVAPGGFVFNIESALSSTNFVTFDYVGTWTEDPPQSPQYEIEVACTVPNSSETYKALSIEFNDVNKFANGDAYSFGFWGISNTGNINVTVNVNKNFGAGGSSFVPVEQSIITLTGTGQFFPIPINFGTNGGLTIGTGPTTVSIDLSFSTSLAFNVSLTDFVLVAGSVVLDDFPAQTNADMITRTIAGWLDVPDYDALDMYLSPVLTQYGMTWDRSIIGKIFASAGGVAHPNDALNATPPPVGNDMPCDGDSYITADRSTLGIPLVRIFDYFVSISPIAHTPIFGTGANYATSYSYNGDTTSFRLTLNANGTGISIANNGVGAAFTFSIIPTYGVSVTGSASVGYKAYNSAANTFMAVSTAAPSSAATAGTSGFTITQLSNATELLAFQPYAFSALCVSAATLAVPSGTGKYFTFTSNSTTYFVWYQITNETAPAPGGTGIKVNLQGTETAQDVANINREVMNAFQSTLIAVGAAPAEGDYWEFQTNPGAARSFLVWYTYTTTSTPPNVANTTPIMVLLPATPTEAQVVTLTLAAINAYQYAAPDFRGVFLRGWDFSGTYDLDVAQRWSAVSGLSGAHFGTFEYQQFLEHLHSISANNFAYTGGAINDTALTGGAAVNTANSGGSETRPVNAYVQWVIKY